jgi:ring-1,2-phenylacetyl-CoA epoxidase subunit PaaE
LPAENIHFELFASPGQINTAEKKAEPAKAAATDEVSNVSVVFDGQQLDFVMPMNGMSILDAAQRHGMDIPFSCKGGMCCTCRAKLEEGEAPMDVNYALEPGEVENGFILTCQAKPKSKRVVVNFDVH